MVQELVFPAMLLLVIGSAMGLGAGKSAVTSIISNYIGFFLSPIVAMLAFLLVSGNQAP